LQEFRQVFGRNWAEKVARERGNKRGKKRGEERSACEKPSVKFRAKVIGQY